QQALSDADLITAIALRGLGHARLVARRKTLSPEVETLLHALRDPEIERLRRAATAPEAAESGSRSEATRQWLRQMMAPVEVSAFYRSLREAAFSGRPSAFEFRLADGAGISLDSARTLCRSEDLTELAMVLCARGVSAEQAFLLICALRPETFGDTGLIRQFIEEFEALDPEACREFLRDWRAPSQSRAVNGEPAW